MGLTFSPLIKAVGRLMAPASLDKSRLKNPMGSLSKAPHHLLGHISAIRKRLILADIARSVPGGECPLPLHHRPFRLGSRGLVPQGFVADAG